MKTFLRGAVLTLTLGLFACASAAPTPILMGRVDELNTEVNQLYVDCSKEANFIPELESCNPSLLETKTLNLLNLTVELIKADVKQPQGYDIHLAASLIFFRISERNQNAYSRAEMIARQFFEVQKASSRGRALNTARYYWAHFTAAHGSWQFFNAVDQLDSTRRTDFLSPLAEGTIALPNTDGIRLIRLQQAIIVLETLISLTS